MAAAQNLSTTLSVLAGARQGDRVLADVVERELLTADPSLLGVWSAFEPNAFDGRDARHVGDPTSDATGRYVSYWFRDGDAVAVTPLVDYDEPGAGDYYLVPRDKGVPVAIEPYSYEVAGEAVMLTSLAVPVRVGGQVVGVAGVDVPLAAVSEQIGAVRPYGVGRAVLVTDGGKVVASNRSGDVAGEAPQGPAADVSAEAVGSGEVAQRTVDGADGPMVLVAAPIQVGEGQNWRCSSRSPRARSLPVRTRCARPS
jgi:methyl-accepting chemotaxis protein